MTSIPSFDSLDDLQNHVVSELKRRAKESKEAGNMEDAMKWLQHSKSAETCVHDSLPKELKKMALLFKQKGDLESAKIFLIHSKQVDQLLQLQKQKEEHDQEITPEEEALLREAMGDTPNDGEASHQEVVEDEQAVNELHEGAESEEPQNSDLTFTDEEMMDEDMMLELQSGGMTIPTQDYYAERILHYKKQALAFKQANDIPKATAQLKLAKTLQKVQAALQKATSGTSEEDDEAWLKQLSAEDTALLGELMAAEENGSELKVSANLCNLQRQPPLVYRSPVDEPFAIRDDGCAEFFGVSGSSSDTTADTRRSAQDFRSSSDLGRIFDSRSRTTHGRRCRRRDLDTLFRRARTGVARRCARAGALGRALDRERDR